MSVQVDVAELAATLEKYGFAYLVTVSEDQSAHVVAVRPVLEGAALVVEGLGRRTKGNVEARPAASLVWPPTEPGGYTLIVDGHASVKAEAAHLEPRHAVLHRPADHGHDCVGLAEA